MPEPMTEEQLRAVTVGELRPLARPVEIVDYDPRWPRWYDREAAKIRASLGQCVRLLQHAGSTSVPNLAAKPVIDIVLAVDASGDEQAYVPALQAAGYELRVREPEWHEHRMLRATAPMVNLHVFSVGCEEIDRMLAFRDWLRTDDDDRALYERAKRELATRQWKYMQNYADAKSVVVGEILARALAR